jgi:hypothetical protein
MNCCNDFLHRYIIKLHDAGLRDQIIILLLHHESLLNIEAPLKPHMKRNDPTMQVPMI